MAQIVAIRAGSRRARKAARALESVLRLFADPVRKATKKAVDFAAICGLAY